MSAAAKELARTEGVLASVLQYGTWCASGVIAVGLALAFFNRQADMPVVAAGIGLLILLPVVRVILMLGAFLRQKDYRFAAVAALVLTIICLGFVAGIMSRSGGGG